MSGVFLICPVLYFYRQSLSVRLKSPIILDFPPSQLQGSSCLCLSNARITSAFSWTQPFYVNLGEGTQVHMLTEPSLQPLWAWLWSKMVWEFPLMRPRCQKVRSNPGPESPGGKCEVPQNKNQQANKQTSKKTFLSFPHINWVYKMFPQTSFLHLIIFLTPLSVVLSLCATATQ